MKNGGNKHATSQPAVIRKSQPVRLRVLVASALPVAAASLESALHAHPDLEVIAASANSADLQNTVRETEPDVLVLDLEEYASANGQARDLLSQLAAVVPTIVLVGPPSAASISAAMHTGVLGILPHAVSSDELASAVRAVASGLLALSPELGEMIFQVPVQPDSDEFEFAAESLTPREHEILALMAEGLLNKEIAYRLKISEHTVKFHISSVMGKLGASSRTEAVTLGIRRGILFL
jgi:DNA-binding NarL/FixJ family response regulator